MAMRYMRIVSAELDSIKKTKIGFSVSKKIGGAVVRNHAKRRMAAAVYPYTDKINEGYHIVFIARAPLRDASFEQISSAVIQLLNRAHLL